MKKFFKKFLAFAVISFSLAACSGSDDNNDPANPQGDANPTHRYTFTVNGNDVNNETYAFEIPFEDHGGGMAYFEPENNYTIVSAYHQNNNPGIKADFVYLDDVIQPLALNETDNQDTSVIFLNFTHQGQNYTLESVSGTCISHFMETFPFGVTNSGKSSFKVGFSGIFRNIVNINQTFQITAGEIEVYNN